MWLMTLWGALSRQKQCDNSDDAFLSRLRRTIVSAEKLPSNFKMAHDFQFHPHVQLPIHFGFVSKPHCNVDWPMLRIEQWDRMLTLKCTTHLQEQDTNQIPDLACSWLKSSICSKAYNANAHACIGLFSVCCLWLLVHSWNSGGEAELISVLHTDAQLQRSCPQCNLHVAWAYNVHTVTQAEATSRRCALSAGRTEPKA